MTHCSIDCRALLPCRLCPGPSCSPYEQWVCPLPHCRLRLLAVECFVCDDKQRLCHSSPLLPSVFAAADRCCPTALPCPRRSLISQQLTAAQPPARPRLRTRPPCHQPCPALLPPRLLPTCICVCISVHAISTAPAHRRPARPALPPNRRVPPLSRPPLCRRHVHRKSAVHPLEPASALHLFLPASPPCPTKQLHRLQSLLSLLSPVLLPLLSVGASLHRFSQCWLQLLY